MLKCTFGEFVMILSLLQILFPDLCIRSIVSGFPSDLPGVNQATLNGMIPYCRVMTKWSGLGDSMELSQVGLSDPPLVTIKGRGGQML
jgi:hypothetical protein